METLNVQNQNPTGEPIKIEIDQASAVTLKLQEFDKKIAEAEATAASLKMQKANFIYEANLQVVMKRHVQQSQVPVQ
jgi:hypothetical protein